MTVVNKSLSDALYKVLLDAAPWWLKVTRAQRFRLEIIATHAAQRVEWMRDEQAGRAHYSHINSLCPHYGRTDDIELRKPPTCICSRRVWARS